MNDIPPEKMSDTAAFVFAANPVARKIDWDLTGSVVVKNGKPFVDLATVKAVEVFDSLVPPPHISLPRTRRMSISTNDGKSRTIECSWPPSKFPAQYGDFEARVLLRLGELQPDVLVGKSTSRKNDNLNFRGLENLRYLGVATLVVAAFHLTLLAIAPLLFETIHAAVLWAIGFALLFAPSVGKRDEHLPASEYVERFLSEDA